MVVKRTAEEVHREKHGLKEESTETGNSCLYDMIDDVIDGGEKVRTLLSCVINSGYCSFCDVLLSLLGQEK